MIIIYFKRNHGCIIQKIKFVSVFVIAVHINFSAGKSGKSSQVRKQLTYVSLYFSCGN